ncbi:hypothetical protein ACNRWW_14035 [Metabacillus sp. HB246100]
MKKFEFKKSYEEIEIAGNVYKLGLSDEDLRKYQKEFSSFFDKQQDFQKIKVDSLSYDEQVEHFDRMKNIIKELIELILGEGTFQPLYEASGKSLVNITELAEYLSEVIGEKLKVEKSAQYKEYVKKVKFGK